MANPQLENGFIRIANDLYKALYRVKLSGSELRVVHFITYQTYGYNRKSRVLTASYISGGTNIPCDTVQKSLDKLIKKNIIISKSNGSHSIRELSLNKNYSTWLVENGKPKTADQNTLTELVENGKLSSDKMANNTKQKNKTDKQNNFFEKPKIEDVISYGIKQGYSEEDCKRFFYYYDGIGWVSGKSKVINWESQLKAFMLNSKQNKQDRCNNAETSKHQDNYTCDEYGNITPTEEWE